MKYIEGDFRNLQFPRDLVDLVEAAQECDSDAFDDLFRMYDPSIQNQLEIPIFYSEEERKLVMDTLPGNRSFSKDYHLFNTVSTTRLL